MASADSQSTFSKPRRPQKDACTDRSPVRGAGTRNRYESKEGENVTSASRRSPWHPQAGIDHLPLGKRQVMDKFFTPVHNPRHEETKTRGHYHYLPHHSHPHQDNEGHGTPGSSNGTAGQGHVHRQPYGYRAPEHLDHPQGRTCHHSSQHHSHCADVSPLSHLHNLEPAASCSRSYSSASSSFSWSSEASIDKEAFLLDGRPGPWHSQSWSSIPVEGQGIWDGEEGAHLEGLDREPKHQHCQDDCTHKLHRRHSKSEEGLLHTNGSENVRPLQLDHSPLYKSASLGRNLAFNDYAEIVLDSEKPTKAPSTVQLPSKGILKNKQEQGGEMGEVSNVRKAKSLEVLSTHVQVTAQGPKGRRGVVGNSKMEDKDVEKRKEAARQSFVQEKLQFSAFLNEITRQVISPSCLSSLGVTDAFGPPSPGQASPKSPRKEQQAEGERQEGEQAHRQQKERSSTPESVLSSAHSHSSKRHHHHRLSIDGSSQQQRSTPGGRTDAGTNSPEHCPPPPPPRHGQGLGGEKQHEGGYSLLLTDGTNTSPELSPQAVRRHHSHANHHPDPLTHCLKHHQRHLAHRSPSPHSHRPSKTIQTSHKDTHSGVPGQESDSSQNKDTASTSSTSLEHSDKNKQIRYKASSVQYKDTVADIEQAQSLQAQNEELRRSLLQTVMRMECMEAKLQKTQMEMNCVKDSFNRLQENASNIQQSNTLLEQKLQTTVLSMDMERKSLTQRISEMSLEQAAAQATILSLKTINGKCLRILESTDCARFGSLYRENEIPSLLQELLDKHFQAKEAVTEFLLPAVVPTQFKDIVLDQASAPGDGQTHALEGEGYAKNWQLGSEGGQRRAATFQPWNHKQGHRMGPEGDQKGGGDVVIKPEGVKETKGCLPLQIPHLQLTTPQPSPSKIPAGGGNGVTAHQLLSVSPEESHPSSKQQQCRRYLNPDMPGLVPVKPTGALLNVASPEGGDKMDPDDDRILCDWRLPNSKGKVGVSRNSLEKDTVMVTYQSAQRMLDDFMHYLQPPEEEREGNGSVKGLASASKEEFLNEDIVHL